MAGLRPVYLKGICKLKTEAAISSRESGNTHREDLDGVLRRHSEICTRCRACLTDCAFLRKHGTPGEVADSYEPSRKEDLAIPFECSLCGLCGAVCPAGLQPADMFLEMRREASARGVGETMEHRTLLDYEKRGTSRRYSWYALPEGCDTVFFPGCALSGTRPRRVTEALEYLRERIPSLGVVLDCCTKPSHDLGRVDHFQSMFGEMKEYLLSQGVKRVITACPNCLQVFRQYGGTLESVSFYEILAESGHHPSASVEGEVTIHDPCSVRQEEEVHWAVRDLVNGSGLKVEEMIHSGRKTICCGEGGAVACVNGDMAEDWTRKRGEQAGKRRIITYCAGCVDFLDRVSPTSHVLDLLFSPGETMEGRAGYSRAPFTYLNRLRLKSRLKRTIPAAVTRERAFTGTHQPGGDGMIRKTALMALFLGALAAVISLGAGLLPI
jgi:Fe-S oxidoreductase